MVSLLVLLAPFLLVGLRLRELPLRLCARLRVGVRGLFELGAGPSHAQVDEAYRLTSDVLPAGLLPIGEDSGGNLYLIDGRDASDVVIEDPVPELIVRDSTAAPSR